jgi:hypothetical protein
MIHVPQVALATLCIAGFAAAAQAYTAAGDRTFPATILLPQIAPSDEVYLRGTTQLVPGNAASAPDNRQSNFTGVFDKTITERFGVTLEGGYNWISQPHASTLTGWQNLEITPQYLVVVDRPREFLLSMGVDQEIGGSGTRRTGADRHGATTPTLYFGKGLGDLDIGYLRPLAITGNVGYQFANGSPRPDLLVAGLVVEYSLPYLESKVKALALPDAVHNLTPMIEFSLTTPTRGNSGATTTALFAPGVNYSGEGWDIGLEALVPVKRASGSGVGVTAQLHFSLDFLFPSSIGRPLFAE